MKGKIWLVIVCFMLFAGCAGKAPQLGIADGRFNPCPDKPNCISSQASDGNHSVAPITVDGSSDDVKTQILKVLSEAKNASIVRSEDDYIRAEFVSTVFRFVDDVEFYFPATQSSSQVTVHVRSASRTGYSDLGANRKRLDMIRQKLGTGSKK